MRLFSFLLVLDFQHASFFPARSVWFYLASHSHVSLLCFSFSIPFFFNFLFQEARYLQCAVAGAGAGQPDGLCERKLQWDLVHMQFRRLDSFAQPTPH